MTYHDTGTINVNLWQMHDMAPCIFSYFFSQSFCWPWSVPSLHCCEDKGIEWRLLNINHSLVVGYLFIIFLFLFMLLVDLWNWKGFILIRLCKVGCVILMSKNVSLRYFTMLLQKYTTFLVLIVRCIDFFFICVFTEWLTKCGFYLNISTDLSRLNYLCLKSLSPSCASLIEV